jgi:hypothetical protein
MRLSVLIALLPAALGAPTRRDAPAPLHVARDTDSLIKDPYIVKYKDITAMSAVEEGIKALAGEPEHVFDGAFKGFSGKIDKKTLELLRDDPNVSSSPALRRIRSDPPCQQSQSGFTNTTAFRSTSSSRMPL